MDTEGDSCNFEYNWDEISVGNFRMNHSNHFFGEFDRISIIFCLKICFIYVLCAIQRLHLRITQNITYKRKSHHFIYSSEASRT